MFIKTTFLKNKMVIMDIKNLYWHVADNRKRASKSVSVVFLNDLPITDKTCVSIVVSYTCGLLIVLSGLADLRKWKNFFYQNVTKIVCCM